MSVTTPATQQATTSVSIPRVSITYCTQCRWMLRAAYFGQELLSTFGNQIGEIALVPATGGLFRVDLTYIPPNENTQFDGDAQVKQVLLWDRKAEGGFPETKVLKQKVRDHIDPKRNLGHSDVGGKKKDAVVVSGGDATSGVSDSVSVADSGESEKKRGGRVPILSVVEERSNEEARAEGKRDARIGVKGLEDDEQMIVTKEGEEEKADGKMVCEDCQ